MKYYVKLDGDIIRDIITYPFDGYVEVEIPETGLPAGVNGGWYRWNGTTFVEDTTLKPIDTNFEIEELKKTAIRLEAIITMNNESFSELTDALIELGVLT